MNEKLVLIDGHSILNRAFYGLPDLTNAQGLHTGAVYGFLNIMFRIVEEERADYLIVAFDEHAPTFRHEMYEAYKGTRKPMPEELREQVPLMRRMLTAMRIRTISQPGLEADDILGTLARRAEAAGMEVALISGDRDLLQIASDHICIRIPKTKRGGTEIEDYHAADVEAAYRMTPAQFIELKALMGDTADNIPGVPKVGEKTATELMVTYGSIEGIYAHLDEIGKKSIRESLAENRELADLSLKLATIKTDCELDVEFEEARYENPYTQEAYTLCKELEFRAFLKKFDTAAPQTEPAAEYTQLTEEGRIRDVLLRAAKQPVTGLTVYPLESGSFLLALDAGDEGGICVFRSGNGDGVISDALRALYEKGRIVTFDAERLYCLIFGEITSQTKETPEQAAAPQPVQMSLEDFLNAGRETADENEITEKRTDGYGEKLTSSEATARLDDLKVMAYLLNPLKSDTKIDDMAKNALGILKRSYEQDFGKKTYAQSAAEDPELFGAFAAGECALLRKLLEVTEADLKAQEMEELYRNVEMPLSYVLYRMEREGIQASAQALTVYGQELAGKIEELEARIYEAAGEEFNINSPKQLAVILFEKMQLPGGKKTKTGYSTSAEVLEKLAPTVPMVRDILDYRTYSKLKSTYADALAGFIAADGRIHTKFQQTVTATGRLSSTDPNLQNIPMRTELGRRIRKVFTPKKGYVFADADYSQIELRILASLSGDPDLIEAYRSGEDIHRITASKVFHVPMDEVTDLQRRNAKAVNFGIVYGISSFGLSQDLSISREEAKAYIEQYFATYPGIRDYLEGVKAFAKETGYSVTYFKRRRPIPELKSSNFMQRQFGERVAMNAPIQGTAADIMKIAMNRVYDRLIREERTSRILLQIHDELLIEVAPGEQEAVLAILNEEMRRAADLPVALEVDAHIGTDWYEAK